MLELLKSQPLIALFALLIVLTLVFVFIFPLFAKVTDTHFWDLVEIRSKKLKERLKKHPIQSLSFILLLIALLSISYYIYLINQPVLISAKDFVKVEKTDLQVLSTKNKFEEFALPTDNLILIDVRDNISYETHIKGAVSYPIEKYKAAGFSPIEPSRVVAVYADKDHFADAKLLAEHIQKQKMKKVYLIEDGYQGLIDAGLVGQGYVGD